MEGLLQRTISKLSLQGELLPAVRAASTRTQTENNTHLNVFNSTVCFMMSICTANIIFSGDLRCRSTQDTPTKMKQHATTQANQSKSFVLFYRAHTPVIKKNTALSSVRLNDKIVTVLDSQHIETLRISIETPPLRGKAITVTMAYSTTPTLVNQIKRCSTSCRPATT